MSESMTVSAKGQITILSSLRGKYGIRTGDKLLSEPRRTWFLLKIPADIFALEGFLSGAHIPNDEDTVSDVIELARAAKQDFADRYIATAAQKPEIGAATFNKKHFSKLGARLYQFECGS